MSYAVGLMGMWLLTDGLFSIIMTHRFNPQKINSWKFDHSFRLIRCAVGIALMVIGGLQ